jgi:hypothetical protein
MTSTSYLLGLTNQIILMSEDDLLNELTSITKKLNDI